MEPIVAFNRPTPLGGELAYLAQVVESGQLAGNGPFTRRCQALLREATGAAAALLTHSATAALEMAAILAGVGPGDEVIMPSFTFCSTANAVALRGGVPVFVDVRPDTLNLDEGLIEAAITPRTRAICVVHYAGVAAQMDEIAAIAARHGLMLIEDAAQAHHAGFRGRPLGSFGALAALSFHETKNIVAGEGGALLVNDPGLAARAEIVWEKGTDRAAFHRGEVARYSWVDLGSSFLPGELTAAFLLAQLEGGAAATARRLAAWQRYHALLAPLEGPRLRRPRVPQECAHNGHIYHVLLRDGAARAAAQAGLAARGIAAVGHYVPLHGSPAGRRHGRTPRPLPVTEDAAARLLRLPLHGRITAGEQARVTAALGEMLAA